MGNCAKKCSVVMFFTSLILIIIALVLLLAWGTIYQRILKHDLIVSNTSTNYEMWKETPIPMYLDVYLFNWTNVDDVLKSKWEIKPVVEECGPYVFSEHHIRVNLQWNTNKTLTYQQKRIWHFLPELSNGTLDDKITNINPIVTVVGHKAKRLPPLLRWIVNLALKGLEGSLVTTQTVNDLIFQGFNDTVLKVVKALNISGFQVQFDKFGWFYGRNESETYDGTFTMYTGEGDLDLIGILDLWNGASYTQVYEGYCAYVNGSAGELWPPIQNLQRLSLFVSDICSTLAIDYEQDESVLDIHGRKYIISNFTFDNGTAYPEQACFKGEDVIPSGVRDASRCKFDAPLFVSLPHFYLADPVYSQAVGNLNPNKTKHEMYLTFEPTSGTVIDARGQLQLSLYLEPVESMNMFQNIKPVYMPMIWFSQHATITEQYTSKLKLLLNLLDIGMYSGWAILGIGLLVGLAWIVYLIFTQRKHKETETDLLIPQEDRNSVIAT